MLCTSSLNTVNPRLRYSRNIRLKSKKELVKKIMYMAVYAIEENPDMKNAARLKLFTGKSLKKNPESTYFGKLSEFEKKSEKSKTQNDVQVAICSSTSEYDSLDRENSYFKNKILEEEGNQDHFNKAKSTRKVSLGLSKLSRKFFLKGKIPISKSLKKLNGKSIRILKAKKV